MNKTRAPRLIHHPVRIVIASSSHRLRDPKSRTVGIVTEARRAFFTTLGVLTNDGGTAARGRRRLGDDGHGGGGLVHSGEHGWSGSTFSFSCAESDVDRLDRARVVFHFIFFVDLARVGDRSTDRSTDPMGNLRVLTRRHACNHAIMQSCNRACMQSCNRACIGTDGLVYTVYT